MRILFIICLIYIEVISACAKGYGAAYIQKNLTVYYNNEKDMNSAKKLADYWISRGLILDKPQTIRYFHTDSVSQVQLIKTPNFSAKALNFDALKKLQSIEDDLNQTIFLRNKVDIVICDSRFNVINNLNF